MIEAYIALGSNINPIENLTKAHELLHFNSSSSIYLSKSLLGDNQNDYLNQVCSVKTHLSPTELLTQLKSIERQIGRQTTFFHGPREIDLDILLYGQYAVNNTQLTIPHKGLKERDFFLKPLFEIYPHKTLPCGSELAPLVKWCDNCACKKIAKDLIDAKEAYTLAGSEY